VAVVILALGLHAVNGLVKSTVNTANALVNKNIDVTIINIIGKNGEDGFLKSSFPLNSKVKKYLLDSIKGTDNQDKTIFYSEKQKYLTVDYTMEHFAALQVINKRLDENDLIIFVHPLAMKIYLKANPNSKVKKLLQIHGNYLEESDNFNLLKEYFKEIDYIQTVSRYMKDDLINILNAPKDKTIYIPNIAVPIKLAKIKDKELKRISIIGSIQKRKNQFDAIKILEYIEDNNVILQIYGHELDKEYTIFIKEYLVRKELTHRVIFKSVATEEEIYSNTDLVILTSEHEGFGYTFLESAMYKIPVLAYDFKYGAKEFLRDGENGCLFEMGDYKALAKKVNEIFESDELYQQIVEDNSNFFNEAYAEEKTVNEYMGLLGDKKRKFDIEHLIRIKMKWVSEEGNNSIIQIDKDIDSLKTTIRIKGNNNKVIIKKNVKLKHTNISLRGNNITLTIEEGVELTGMIASLFQNTLLSIDKNSTLGNSELTIAEETKVTIGKDCMFAHNCEIRTSDMHPIYSIIDGKRLNYGKDIIISDHCWLGKNVTILKGTEIKENCVIGINSVVTKSILEKNVIATGSPAKIIKRDIIWGRKMYHQTMYDDPTLVEFIDNYKQDLKNKIELLDKIKG